MGKHPTAFIWGLGDFVVPCLEGGSSISTLLLQGECLLCSAGIALAMVEVVQSVVSLGETYSCLAASAASTGHEGISNLVLNKLAEVPLAV